MCGRHDATQLCVSAWYALAQTTAGTHDYIIRRNSMPGNLGTTLAARYLFNGRCYSATPSLTCT
jgi:hypothetical protein